jgi:predicted transglutaminase-like cysteine proteinase
MMVDASIFLLAGLYFFKFFIFTASLGGGLPRVSYSPDEIGALKILPSADYKQGTVKAQVKRETIKEAQKLNVVSFRKSKKAAVQTGLFGSREIKNTRLKAFRKWNGLLQRHQKDLKKIKYQEPGVKGLYRQSGSLKMNGSGKMICGNNKRILCAKDKWTALLAGLKKSDKREQLQKINRYLNQVDYITDIENWGLNDYWATLKQFFSKDGDCEDYAIAKYFSLKKLGFKTGDMRIAVVQDMNLNVPHAVLIVY